MSAVGAQAEANPVRREPPPVRWIVIQLTPFAPGCADLPGNDLRRWIQAGAGAPLVTIRSLLDRLERTAGDVEAFPQQLGDIAIVTVAAPRVPLAFVVEGLTLPEITQALNRLAKSPAPKSVAPQSSTH